MRGGKREGAGRKVDPATEKTRVLSVRLPLSVYNRLPLENRAAFIAAAIEAHANQPGRINHG